MSGFGNNWEKIGCSEARDFLWMVEGMTHLTLRGQSREFEMGALFALLYIQKQLTKAGLQQGSDGHKYNKELLLRMKGEDEVFRKDLDAL